MGCSLGEIALHLSLQAVWRWPDPMTTIEETTARCRQFLYRCVLEARLQQLRQPDAKANGMKLPRDGNVGPLPACDSFAEYAEKACGRLGIVWEEEEAARLDALWQCYSHLERPMRCFVMLRGVLSRPIERMITLDRLLFMKEQLILTTQKETTTQTMAQHPNPSTVVSCTVEEIFDPRLSPRSHAIVATWGGGSPLDEQGRGAACEPCVD